MISMQPVHMRAEQVALCEVYSTPVCISTDLLRCGSAMMVIKRVISCGHAIRGF
jgi:hypothetical protein